MQARPITEAEYLRGWKMQVNEAFASGLYPDEYPQKLPLKQIGPNVSPQKRAA